MARPTVYDPAKNILVEGWARDGLTNDQIAQNIGIAPSALYRWQKRYPEFAAALKKGKEVADREVENALFKRAMGYRYDEVTREARGIVDSAGQVGEEMVETKRVTKEVLPDVTAQIFWLKNRKPRDWRDKRDVGIDGEIKFAITLPEDIEADGSDGRSELTSDD